MLSISRSCCLSSAWRIQLCEIYLNHLTFKSFKFNLRFEVQVPYNQQMNPIHLEHETTTFHGRSLTVYIWFREINHFSLNRLLSHRSLARLIHTHASHLRSEQIPLNIYSFLRGSRDFGNPRSANYYRKRCFWAKLNHRRVFLPSMAKLCLCSVIKAAASSLDKISFAIKVTSRAETSRQSSITVVQFQARGQERFTGKSLESG